MTSLNQNVIHHKIGLLNLATELGNVSKACKVMGLSGDTFYRYQNTVATGGVEALFEAHRKQANPEAYANLQYPGNSLPDSRNKVRGGMEPTIQIATPHWRTVLALLLKDSALQAVQSLGVARTGTVKTGNCQIKSEFLQIRLLH